MKLVLDEMWNAAIAVELRRRGHDVVAAQEREQAHYAGVPDDEVFAIAQEESRAVVTDNVPDYQKARLEWEATGREHHGVVYALNPPFNRHRGNAVIGQMVRALHAFLNSAAAQTEPFNSVHYLRAAD